MPAKKKRKGTSKKASRFPLFRTLALLGVVLLTGLTLLLILRLPQKPANPEQGAPPRSEVKQGVAARLPDHGPATEHPAPPQVATPPLEQSPVTPAPVPPLAYEAPIDDFEARVRDADLAILKALDSAGQSESVLRHRAVEARKFRGQEFHYQNLTLHLRPDVFPFLAALEHNLEDMVPGSDLQALDGNPRDLEISIQGQPTHHLFIPLPSTPPKPEPVATTPRLVIIIDDLGESTKTAQRLAKLPFPVSFSVLPFTTKAREVAGIARNNDLELLLHLPCEPLGYPKTNSGPGTLRAAMSPAELERALVANLARLPEVDGVNNHMGSKLTQDKKAMRTVLAHLKGRGKFFVDSLTTPKSCVDSVSASLGMRYRRRHVFLDNTPQKQAILLQLKKAEALARKSGLAVAIGHPYPATLAALETWAGKRDTKIVICKARDI